MQEMKVEGEGGSSAGEPPDESDFVERDPTGRYGRYNDILGKGSSKTVYRAFDEIDGIEVAWNQVKINDVLQTSDDFDRLYSEVRLLKTVKHKNIIKFYNSWVDNKNRTVNIITEIFTSGNLRQYRKKHKHVDMKAVKGWARQVLQGLQYLHSHNPPIIHRDLKCDNIFVNGNHGEVKIGDLGLATIMRQAHVHSVIGTPEFMAPELYEEDYNELVDIYSFGMCLLEMVTFEYPYSECKNPAQIYKKVSRGIKPAALEKVKDPQVRAFIEKCLVAAPERLPAKELLLDPFLQSDGHNCILTPANYIPTEEEPKSVYSLSEEAVTGVHENMSFDHTSDSSVGGDDADIPLASVQVKSPISKKIFRLKGKKIDESTIDIRLRIAEPGTDARLIHFEFNVETDTAIGVAQEMIEHLEVSDEDSTHIVEAIDTLIEELVCGWQPSAINEESINFRIENGNSTFEEYRMKNEEDSEHTEEPSVPVVANATDVVVVDGSPSSEELVAEHRFEGQTYGRFEEISCIQSGSEYSPPSSAAPRHFVGNDPASLLSVASDVVAGPSLSLENENFVMDGGNQKFVSISSSGSECDASCIKVEISSEHGRAVPYMDASTNYQTHSSDIGRTALSGGVSNSSIRHTESTVNSTEFDEEGDEELCKYLEILRNQHQQEIIELQNKHKQIIEEAKRVWRERKIAAFKSQTSTAIGESKQPNQTVCKDGLEAYDTSGLAKETKKISQVNLDVGMELRDKSVTVEETKKKEQLVPMEGMEKVTEKAMKMHLLKGTMWDSSTVTGNEEIKQLNGLVTNIDAETCVSQQLANKCSNGAHTETKLQSNLCTVCNHCSRTLGTTLNLEGQCHGLSKGSYNDCFPESPRKFDSYSSGSYPWYNVPKCGSASFRTSRAVTSMGALDQKLGGYKSTERDQSYVTNGEALSRSVNFGVHNKCDADFQRSGKSASVHTGSLTSDPHVLSQAFHGEEPFKVGKAEKQMHHLTKIEKLNNTLKDLSLEKQRREQLIKPDPLLEKQRQDDKQRQEQLIKPDPLLEKQRQDDKQRQEQLIKPDPLLEKQRQDDKQRQEQLIKKTG
eukprot:TRINITY_DN553_c0_g1_i1.p1 TRINITY_DN553_c0_g1~~TRINITY_DN553_c0_g1_i1.p1  ORF type:complete len:1075 (-),score=283.12 TRINITY_DN553_c0_g1_i1:318-3542(-)